MPGLTGRTCSGSLCVVVSGSRPVPCYNPWKAYRGRDAATGQAFITNNPAKAINSSNPITLPCGGCIGCRLDRVAQWAIRCHHEAQMHEFNSFITLTFDDAHLPEDYSVDVRTWQLFMKRLRKSVPLPLRFFACGEYGAETLRPHYHALIFGYAFPDRDFYMTSKGGDRLYQSQQLSKAWPYGLALLGDVTYQSAQYVAGYCMKKIGGDLAASHYLRTHPVTNVVCKVQPEFSVQSRRPGIGSTWFDKFHSDAFPSDFLVVDGKMHPVPRYYSLKLDERALTLIKRKRKRASLPRKANSTPERLKVREEVRKARVSRLKRTLE